jgi:hypothetical protein
MKRLVLLPLLALATAAAARGASISIYISPPSVQFSEVAGTTVATFDSLAPGNLTTPYASAIGTYNASPGAPFHVNAPDQYGGATDPANPTTPTNYFTIGAQSGTSAPVTVNLNQSADYFGFWWSAGDANNGVSLYIGSFLLTRFTSQTLLTMLNGGSGQVTAINGTKYNTSAYYGNPNAPLLRNTGEPYVFIDLVANGVSFDRVVFDNSGTTSSGFESDNHTVSWKPVAISGDHVLVGTPTTATPEPSETLLISAGLLLIAARLRRERASPRTR